jgi:hypothetical protein
VLDLSSLPSGFSLPLLSQPIKAAPTAEPVNEADGEEIIYDSDDELLPQSNNEPGEPGEQPVPPESPEPVVGPETATEADPQTGRRINVPNAELETEETLGGESR